MERKELLQRISFGSQVAEDERRELARYFVETDQWSRIANNEIDIIRGVKGSGKSAIYSLLIEKEDEFFDKRILLIAGENPRGDTVFGELVTEPPASEQEFIYLWKLYILVLVAKEMREYSILSPEMAAVYKTLEADCLLETKNTLASILRNVQRGAKRLLSAIKIEGTLEIDPATGLPKISGRISPKEPSIEERKAGIVSINSLFVAMSQALTQNGWNVWVLLDRLDVAFVENHGLEANALRALMRVYNDLKAFDNINLKIFIREDIWKRISEGGFREASHIIRYVLLDWSETSLLNLVIRRLLSNDVITSEFGINRDQVLQNLEEQNRVFYRLFPPQIEQGPQKAKTLNWMITRCADSTAKTAPRELIHLLNCLREEEAIRLGHGGVVPQGEEIFDRSMFKKALPAVSTGRLHQFLYAEYPQQKSFLEALRDQKTEQNGKSLSELWRVTEQEAIAKARELVALGFFQERGVRENPTFWVPFLYRPSLNMVQGKAWEAGKTTDDDE